MSITLAAQPLGQAPTPAAAPIASSPLSTSSTAIPAAPLPSPSPPPTSASFSSPSSPTSTTPVFHLQLTAASTTSLAIELASSSSPPAGQTEDDSAGDEDVDVDETGSATSELPYPACDLKRVRFPCPFAEAERFVSLHETYSPAEYDRTPILISEEGRSCVLPERGSKRCYFYSPDADVAADGGLVVDELAARDASDHDDSASETESSNEGALPADASAVSAEEDEMMDRRIAMMRSMGLAVAAGLAAAMDEADLSPGRRSPSGGDISPEGDDGAAGDEAKVDAEDRSLSSAGQKELDDELVRIRERCRTRFGLWRVETAEFASEDPNACGSPREPCTPNPSPMSPPMALGGSSAGTAAADGNSPTPPAVVAASSYSYFGVPSGSRRRSSASLTRPIAIPAGPAAAAGGSGSSSVDGPASATPTSSLVGLSIPRRIPSRDDADDDDDETGSPNSLGAASPATRRMMWCAQLRSGPLPTAYTAEDSDDDDEEAPAVAPHRLEDEEEHQDESRGMRRWLFDGGRVVSDSPPPTPGWDDGTSSFLVGGDSSRSSIGSRPALARSSGAGFPFTRVCSLPASSSTSSSASSSTAASPPPTTTSFSTDRNGSSSTVYLGSSISTLAFAKKSPPATPSGPTASLLRSALAPSPPAAIDTAVTPTWAAAANFSEASSTPTAATSAAAAAAAAADLMPAATPSSLHLLASPSSSACSSTDTFLTDSDPPSLVSLASSGFSSGSSGSSEHGEPVDHRWDLHTELARNAGFRSPSAAAAASAAAGVDKRGGDVFGGGWTAGAEASEYLLGSRDIW